MDASFLKIKEENIDHFEFLSPRTSLNNPHMFPNFTEQQIQFKQEYKENKQEYMKEYLSKADPYAFLNEKQHCINEFEENNDLDLDCTNHFYNDENESDKSSEAIESSPIKFKHSQITQLNINYMDGPLEPLQTRQVFIGNLSYKGTDETLKNHFAKYGDLVQCKAHKCYGFITYMCSFMVDELMKHRPHTVDGRKVYPMRATGIEVSKYFFIP